MFSLKPCSILWRSEFRRNIGYHAYASTRSFLRIFVAAARLWKAHPCVTGVTVSTTSAMRFQITFRPPRRFMVLIVYGYSIPQLAMCWARWFDQLCYCDWPCSAARLIFVQCIFRGITIKDCSTVIFLSPTCTCIQALASASLIQTCRISHFIGGSMHVQHSWLAVEWGGGHMHSKKLKQTIVPPPKVQHKTNHWICVDIRV